jgi:effector-binding domain-containing protein
MVFRLVHRSGGMVLLAGVIAVLASTAGAAPSDKAQTSPPAATTPNMPAPPQPPQPAAPAPAPANPEGLRTKPGDAFGEDVTLSAKPIVYLKGSGTWDQAFATISGALKKVEAYMAQKGLKADGLPMTIFTSTDDHGFDYEAAIPLAEAPKEQPPQGEVALGRSPDGHALEFVHRGSYETLDDTYEAITNYLDDKQLESQDVLIEQYVTDPAKSDANNLVINVLVLTK